MSLSNIKIYVLLILSVFILSSCEVYQTLYGEIPPGNESDLSIPIEQEKGLVEIIPSEDGKEAPNAIIVQETELVSLQPNAEDPDADKLTFTFTSPLDEKGNWQTNYGDEGEYTVTVAASDGQLIASKDVLIVVKKKEEPPVIDSAKPIEAAVFVNEDSEMEFSVEASDLNKDDLSYEWKLDGEEAGKDRLFVYKPDYDAAGSHTLKVDISDGTSSVSSLWSVTVNNVNRPPELNKIADITAKEDEEIAIITEAFDSDGDKLTYNIDDQRFSEESEGTFTWKTDYNSAGKYVVKASVSDGQDTVTQDVNINIENVNRPPVIMDIIQKK